MRIADAASQPAPASVGRYDLLLPIASGGMATVYLARSRGVGGFERQVALKLTHQHLLTTEGFARELIEEAKLAAKIHHPNVVATLDVGDDPLGVFLVMEYIEGDTLAGLLRHFARAGTRLPPAIGLRLLTDALRGLHAAHELEDDLGHPLGLVHRDFSPQNILAGIDGIGRLADFGVAKAATRIGHTRSGLVKGKIAYMSPEQARDEPLDRRCDVWASGVIAWEVITGRRLHRGRGDTAILLEVVSQPPPLLGSVKKDVGARLESAVARALAMNPNDRWPTAEAFLKELKKAADERYGPIDDSALAECVTQAAMLRLTSRRERVRQLLELRARIEAVSHEHTPSHDGSSGSGSAPLGTAGSYSASDTSDLKTDTTSVSPPAPMQASSVGRSRRRSWLVALGAVGIAGIALAAVLTLWGGPRHPPLVTENPTSVLTSAIAVAPTPAPVPPAPSASFTASAKPSAAPTREQTTARGRPAARPRTSDSRKQPVSAPASTSTSDRPAWGF